MLDDSQAYAASSGEVVALHARRHGGRSAFADSPSLLRRTAREAYCSPTMADHAVSATD